MLTWSKDFFFPLTFSQEDLRGCEMHSAVIYLKSVPLSTADRMRKEWHELKRYRKWGKELVEWDSMPQSDMVVGGKEGLWRAMRLNSWGVDRWGFDGSLCITDPCPLSVHTHSPSYSNSAIQKDFPTGKVKAPIRGHFVTILWSLWGIVSEKRSLLIERICLNTPSPQHFRLSQTYALTLV